MQRLAKTVVFTNGCFDLLHRGHCSLLEFCREIAGKDGAIIVAVNTDASIARLKGPARPIMPLEARIASIGLLGIVDEILALDAEDPTEMVRSIRPDVLVKGEQYRGTLVPGSQFAGRVEFAPMVPGISTTSILASIRSDA